jgi:carbamoyltransferase
LLDGAPHHWGKRFRHAREDSFAWRFVEHHLAYEASAFVAAPFDTCAALTMDGRGEGVATSLWRFEHGKFMREKQIELPHSLGILYESVTRYPGFLHSSDEY